MKIAKVKCCEPNLKIKAKTKRPGRIEPEIQKTKKDQSWHFGTIPIRKLAPFQVSLVDYSPFSKGYYLTGHAPVPVLFEDQDDFASRNMG